MKKSFFSILGFITLVLTVGNATNLVCEFDHNKTGFNQGTNAHVIITDQQALYCREAHTKDFEYIVKMTGIGGGLSIEYAKTVLISCLGDNFLGTYAYTQARVACMLGAQAGVCIGLTENVKGKRRPNLCTIGGVQFGFGASLSGGKLTIQRNW